jgi:uncharacterized protein involved in exopolysaccharide biosynthesis
MSLTHYIPDLGARIETRLPRFGVTGNDARVLARCCIGAILCAALAWGGAAAYLIVTPKLYVSRWTFILPGAGQNATIQLDSIGQTTTSVNSPYASVSLNPKTVYKEIASSEQVRWAAAESMGMTFDSFGRRRIKLIDETSLMMFELPGRTPEQAHAKAHALIKAFNAQLDVLRQDELAKRSEAVTNNLKSYKEQVDSARQRITNIQVASGLVSINQFNELVASFAAARRKLSDLGGDLDRLRQEQSRLIARMGIDASNASIALRLASDPAWVKVVADYSEASGQYTSESRRLGPANPILVALANRREAALASLRRLLTGLGLDPNDGRSLVLVNNISHQAEMLQQLVRTEAQISGKTQELQTITADKDRLEDEIGRLSAAAAKLEDLRKEQILAEAVYSSALARVDTSKSDIYGAYPIVQVVSAPTMPEGHEQPRRIYAIAGGLAGTFFSALAWGLVWLHYFQTMKRRKKRSSTG